MISDIKYRSLAMTYRNLIVKLLSTEHTLWIVVGVVSVVVVVGGAVLVIIAVIVRVYIRKKVSYL